MCYILFERPDNLFNAILKYIFPPRCVSCADILPINYIGGVGGDFPHLDRMCEDCLELLERDDNNNADSNFSLYVYNNTMRQAIHRFKYGTRPKYGVLFGMMMAEYAAEILPGGFVVDAVVPVPLHSDKHLERGFNQAEILAAAMCEQLALTPPIAALSRARRTDRQAYLGVDERRKNVEDAFVVIGHETIVNKTILLIDDIHTTGSTIEACKSALFTGGARFVFSYALARARLEDTTLSDSSAKVSKSANINDKLFR